MGTHNYRFWRHGNDSEFSPPLAVPWSLVYHAITEPNPECVCMRGTVDKVGYLFHREYVELNRGGSLE